MANKYNDILALVNAGNQMGLSNTIKRDYGIPLDFTSVQKDYDDAVKYAATSTLAYVGQPISVGDKLYIITETSAGKHTVGVGESAVEYDVYLAEVGSATEGDGNTIELDGKVLKLAGLKGLDNSKTYVPSLVNGKLVWAEPDTSTAEGQAQEINALKARAAALEETVNGIEASEGVEEKEGLVDKVAANTQAIADETSARIAAITEVEGKIPTDYVKDTTYNSDKAATELALANRYTKTEADDKFIAKEDAYDDTALAGRVSALETGIGNVYTKEQTYTKDEVNSAIAGMSHFSVKVVEGTQEMTDPTVLYLVHDTNATGADKYNEYLVIGGTPTLIGDTTTDLSDYVTNGALTTALSEYAKTADLSIYAKAEEVNSNLANKVDIETYNTDKATFALKSDMETALGGKVDNDTLNNYYTKNDIDGKGYAVAETVNSQLAAKADAATTLAGYGITDAYTKTEVYAKTDLYTKTEIDRLLDEVSGGSSETAASVKRALDGYIKNMDTEVYGTDVVEGWTGEDGSYTPTYAETDSRVDKNAKEIAAVRTLAQKGVDDAAAASSAITALETGAVATNASDITALKGRVATLETAKGDHETRISGVEGRVTALEAQDKTIGETLGTIQGNITALQEKDSELTGLISANSTEIAKKADKTALEALTGNVYTKEEVDNLLTGLDLTTVKSDVAANKAAIEAEVSRATSAEAANKALIDVLVGEDENKSARAIATEVLAGALEGANEDFDTLLEMAQWLEDHSADAIEMDNRIKANEAILAGFGGEGEPADVKSYVNSSIAAAAYELPVATLEALGGIKSAASTLDNGVQVSVDGIATVGRVNVNTLVQTEGETFVLNGGKAVAAAV